MRVTEKYCIDLLAKTEERLRKDTDVETWKLNAKVDKFKKEMTDKLIGIERNNEEFVGKMNNQSKILADK